MLPLHTSATVSDSLSSPLLKVLDLPEALAGWFPFKRIAVRVPADGPIIDIEALRAVGFSAVVLDRPLPQGERLPLPALHSLRNPSVVSSGDVIRVHAGTGQVAVLYRRGANANNLFVTEQCNSKCLMCSQPPRNIDDRWRLSEIFDLLPLIDPDLEQLGVTGGEPTLLGAWLPELIRRCKSVLPKIRLHILTNGRNFEDPVLADSVADGVGVVVWAIPLYADVPSRHDFVVQARGAFEATLKGIYSLVERGHSIEIRFVLHAQTVPRMERFAEFVYRNLPFVSHVAFMGLEPIGYAKVNRASLWIDPLDYAPALERAAWYLHDRGITTSIYNVPLCLLPRSAWPLARQSISDWKNVYEPECEGCTERPRCCGFFASTGPAWRSRGIKAFVL
jgi:His-Xaa-Ser system radical SAM maturase HxsC